MNYENVPTPSYVVDEELLVRNLERLKKIENATGCHILLAQKCFSMYSTYPLIGKYLSGTTASGLYEAKLGKEYMSKENHVFSAAYRDDEMDEILSVCDHVVFNSFSQWKRFRDKAMKSGCECGLRINPECSTQEGHAIYDPCAPFSRMGITREKFEGESLEGISGLHFHTLCEQNSDDLETTLQSIDKRFCDILYQIKWLNFGGGHHITRADYDVERLIRCICHMKEKYDLEIYIEPGEAVALNAGFLVSTVLDIVENGRRVAVLDTSAACHMPDVIEMPYTPPVKGAKINTLDESGFLYRLAGPTCLAGDIIGDYRFDHELQIGERIIFEDMAIYSMVKTNTFNGMPLPSLAYCKDGEISIIRKFSYEDFRNRLS